MEINNNSERNRHIFVDFKGKREVTIETGINLFRSSGGGQWSLFINKLLDEASKLLNILDKNILNLFIKKFFTTTR